MKRREISCVRRGEYMVGTCKGCGGQDKLRIGSSSAKEAVSDMEFWMLLFHDCKKDRDKRV